MAEDTEKKELKQIEIPSLSDDDLREFILAMCDNRVFSSAHMNEHESIHIGMVFLPIALGALAEYDPESLKRIGVIYEYYDQALPRCVNGMPIFPSMRMLNRPDWLRANASIKREQERRKELIICQPLTNTD